MVRVRTDKKALVHASRMMFLGNARKGFVSGFLFGLSSAGLVLASAIPAPKAPREGMTSDWKAVGGDLKSAMGKRG